jgi:chromosome segregation ATPase
MQDTVTTKDVAEGITATVTAAVTSTIAGSTGLAEKYAHAAHRIGELEAEVRHLTEDRTRLLTKGQDQGGEIERLRAELATEGLRPPKPRTPPYSR